jgi:hypothetical protein
VALYLEKAEVLSMVEMCQALHDTETPLPICQKHLIVTLASWGSILDAGQPPAVTTKLLALMVESESALMAEPDSLDKFFVSAVADVYDQNSYSNYIVSRWLQMLVFILYAIKHGC